MDMKKKTSYVILLDNREYLCAITGVDGFKGLKTSSNMANVLVFYELEQAKNFLNTLIHLCITNELETKEYIEKAKIVQITVIDEQIEKAVRQLQDFIIELANIVNNVKNK